MMCFFGGIKNTMGWDREDSLTNHTTSLWGNFQPAGNGRDEICQIRSASSRYTP